MAGPLVSDAFWVKNAFVVLQTDIDTLIKAKRYRSSASDKFTDTTPGGNLAINPLPQFTRYCDPRAPGVKASNAVDSSGRDGRGMGHYYSDAFDENAQIINMRFGVPEFNSMTTFFTGFYSSEASQLARTGRAGSLFYSLGKATGFIVGILSWKLLAVTLLGAGYRYALQKPSSKFYYLKPTMPTYWTSVQTIMNQLAVNSGIVPRVGGEDQQQLNGNYQFDDAAKQRIAAVMPDIFRPDGGIDVYAISTKAQRLAIKRRLIIQQTMNEDGNESLASKVTRILDTPLTDGTPANYPDYLNRWLQSTASSTKGDAGQKDPSTENIQYDANGNRVEELGLGAALDAELHDGGAFVSFRVNATGQVSESFSNAVVESEIAQSINNMASQARSTNFNFAGGNLVGGAVGDALGSIAGAAKSFLGGAADSLGISGLATLGGAAFVDIPKHWQSSTANLPRASYSIDLPLVYGNNISRLLQIFLPFACLLAGSLPLSAGKQAYTSPFLCELYDSGRCQIRTGMIDSISITRGTGNLGFNNDNKLMGMQIQFSVVDMSSIMHMPISQGFSFGKLARGIAGAALGAAGGAEAGAVGGTTLGAIVGGPGGAVVGGGAGTVAGAGAGAILGAGLAMGTFDDDNSFTDYMAAICGMDLYDQIYAFPKAKLALTREMQNFNAWRSNSHIASFLGDLMPARLLSAIYTGTVRQ